MAKIYFSLLLTLLNNHPLFNNPSIFKFYNIESLFQIHIYHCDFENLVVDSCGGRLITSLFYEITDGNGQVILKDLVSPFNFEFSYLIHIHLCSSPDCRKIPLLKFVHWIPLSYIFPVPVCFLLSSSDTVSWLLCIICICLFHLH